MQGRLMVGLVAVLVLAGCASTPPATTPAASPRAAASPATPASTRPVRLTLAPDSSEARYHIKEQLVGRSLPGEAVGRTRAVSGSLVLEPDGAVAEPSKIVVDLRTLKSDEGRRDNFIQRNPLETATYPQAEFVLREAPGLPAPLPETGEATFQMIGDLTVHGVTRSVTWEAEARFDGATVSGTARTTVKLTDFGMTPPKAGPVLSIEDDARLELDFQATRELLPG